MSTVAVCLDVLCLFVLGFVFIYMNTLLIAISKECLFYCLYVYCNTD